MRTIRAERRAAWEEETGYHRRSLAETAMSRFTGTFGDQLKNRRPPNQKIEAVLGVKLLNAFVAIGMPLLLWI